MNLTRITAIRIIMPLCLMGLLLLLLWVFILRVDGKNADDSIYLEIQRIKEEIHSIHLVCMLELTEEQVQSILVQSEKARPLVESYRASMPDMYRFQQPAFRAFLRENEANEGFSPEVLGKASHARHMVKQAYKEMVDRVNELAEPLYGVFRYRQLRMLEDYKPSLFPSPPAAESEKPFLNKRAQATWAAFAEALDLPEASFAQSSGKLIDRIVNALPRYTIKNHDSGENAAGPWPGETVLEIHRFENREAAQAHVRGLLEKLRDSKPGLAKTEIERFIDQRINPKSLKALEREMVDIEHSKSPILTSVGRYLLNPDVQAFLKGEAGKSARDEAPIRYTKLDASIDEIRDLREKLDIMNLINGLQLTREQVEIILHETRQAAQYMFPPSLREAQDPETTSKELGLLRSMRDHLLERRSIPESLKRQYGAIKNRHRIIRTASALPPPQREKVIESAQRIQNALLTAQQHIIVNYESCLIPPKELYDPLRVGEAGDTDARIKRLDTMRALSPALYAQYMDKFLDLFLFWTQDEFGAFSAEQKIDFLDKVKGIFDRAREMNDVEYALNKRDLAEAIAPFDREEALHQCLMEAGVLKFQIEGRIMKYLFRPPVIPLMEARLERLANFGVNP